MKHLPRNTDYLVIDPPARMHGSELTGLVKHVETIVVPVLPSPIDIGAAAKFVKELQEVGKVERREVKVAVVSVIPQPLPGCEPGKVSPILRTSSGADGAPP